MKKLQYLFTTFALILSHLMCITVVYNYRDMLCGIAHGSFSAPADVAFLTAIPYAAGILLCGILAAIFRKKAK